MHQIKSVVILLLLIFSISCAAQQEGSVGAMQLDESFSLSVGDSIRFADGKDQFWMYLDKIEDNRCPLDVNCITGGKTSVTLRLENKGANKRTAASFCLGADCRELKDNFLWEDTNRSYNIVLEEVSPYPQTGNEKATKRAIFKIKRATG